MPNVSFKAKVQTVYNMDDTIAYQFVQVPELKRAHCDMSAFRSHPRYSAYANSDLFPNLDSVPRRGVRAPAFEEVRA